MPGFEALPPQDSGNPQTRKELKDLKRQISPLPRQDIDPPLDFDPPVDFPTGPQGPLTPETEEWIRQNTLPASPVTPTGPRPLPMPDIPRIRPEDLPPPPTTFMPPPFGIPPITRPPR